MPVPGQKASSNMDLRLRGVFRRSRGAEEALPIEPSPACQVREARRKTASRRFAVRHKRGAIPWRIDASVKSLVASAARTM